MAEGDCVREPENQQGEHVVLVRSNKIGHISADLTKQGSFT